MAVADDRENSIGGTIRITEDGDKAEMSMTLKVDPTDVGLLDRLLSTRRRTCSGILKGAIKCQ